MFDIFVTSHMDQSNMVQATISLTIDRQIWAATCDFKQCGILTSVDLDEPVQPRIIPRNPKWCSVSSLTLIE